MDCRCRPYWRHGVSYLVHYGACTKASFGVIYEYQCVRAQCKHEFETEQKITELPIAECPKCGAVARRLISKSTFVLHGSGWAADSYK